MCCDEEDMKYEDLNNGDIFATIIDTEDKIETIFIKTESIRNDWIYGNCIVFSSSDKNVNIHRGSVAYVSPTAKVVRYKINELICTETDNI